MDPSILSRVSSFLGQNPTTAATAGFLCSSPSQTQTELTTYAAGRFHVIIFTKDRPWQLQQLLLSMQLDKIGDYKVTIIANVRPDFEDGYRQVQHEFTDQIDFLVESTDRTFRVHLLTVIHAHVGETHLRWMLLTDDCILLEPLNDVLEKSGSSDIFLTRLHPGITWCQTRNLPSPAPKNHLRYQTACFTYPVVWKGGLGISVDLSGGIYSNELVQNVLQQCDEEETSHPNKLELAGYAILRKCHRP
ncbi:glycosyl transferase [Fragilaria crotonensis]|nr:glycosyl transferase [Fragilaria crotonensis]